jgi:hypothetical protein
MQQGRRAGIGFTAADNAFTTVDDPRPDACSSSATG